MLVLAFLFAFFARCEESSLPFSDDEIYDDSDAEESQEESDIKENEKDIQATPTPAPPPREKVPLNKLFGSRELVVLGISIIYAFIFYVGRTNVKRRVQKCYEILAPFARKYFAVVNKKFYQKNNREYMIYMTGRTGYISGIVTLRFKRSHDILGIIYSMVNNEHEKIIVDMILNPKYEPSGVLFVGKEKPYYADDFKLKGYTIKKLQCYTDFKKERTPFVEVISEFIKEQGNLIDMIELCDNNRFEFEKTGKYVAHFEFRCIRSIQDCLNEDVFAFIMKLSDLFTSAHFPYEIQSANLRTREKITQDYSSTAKEEKKLTPEEEAKLEKKRERREKNKFRPKFVKS